LQAHQDFIIVTWTFVDYLGPNGANPVRKWWDDLPVEARARIDDRIDQMRSLDTWSDKWAKRYKGTDRLFEIRIKANNVQYRPLGMYHPTRRRCFIILHGAIEKGDRILKSDVQVAEKRSDELLEEPHRVVDHDY
jgi:phage-related protein